MRVSAWPDLRRSPIVRAKPAPPRLQVPQRSGSLLRLPFSSSALASCVAEPQLFRAVLEQTLPRPTIIPPTTIC